jgi:hypothetical protein
MKSEELPITNCALCASKSDSRRNTNKSPSEMHMASNQHNTHGEADLSPDSEAFGTPAPHCEGVVRLSSIPSHEPISGTSYPNSPK